MKYNQIEPNKIQYGKLGQEKIIEMFFPFYQWVPDEKRQQTYKSWRNTTKLEKSWNPNKNNKNNNNNNNKANLRTLRINAHDQKPHCWMFSWLEKKILLKSAEKPTKYYNTHGGFWFDFILFVI